MKSGKSLQLDTRGLAVVFLVIAGLLVGGIGVTYWAGVRVVKSNERQSAKRSVIDHLDKVLSTLTDAETGQRGYLLVGKDAYLEPYHAARTVLQGELKTVADLASAGELPEESVNRLQTLADQKLAVLEQTIEDRRENGMEAALATVRSGRGKQIMDDIRLLIGEMRGDEETKYKQAVLADQSATTARTTVFLITALLNLTFLAWAYRRIAHEIRRRETAFAETDRQKELLATTLASIGDGVIVTDANTRITFINGVAAAMTGWSAELAQGVAIADVFKIINEQTRAAVENPVDHVLRTGAVVGLANHTLLIRKDGSELPIDDSGAPICGADGRMRGVVLVFRDITARKRAEDALRESEERFRTMANSIPQLAWIARADGYIVWYNQRWHDVTGTTPQQMEGWGWQSVHDPAVLPQVIEQWKASIGSGEPFEMEFPLRMADGHFRLFLTRAMPLKDAQGRVIQWFGTNTDITERHQAEAAMRESEERFRLLFQQAAVGIKRLDGMGRLREVNDKQCDILGYPREELLQLSLADFTYADDLLLERKELARLMAREIPSYSIEKRCVRKDGAVIWVRVTSSLPHNDDKRAPWWISVVEDITQRKQAEESLRQTAKELARSNQDLEQFAYVASHDLQEPLRMVAGYLQLLSDRYRGHLDEKADKFIAYAVDGAERMSGLIRDLLAYSRVNTRGERFQETSAEDALAAALKNLGSAIEESGAVIHCDPLPMVRADKSQLRQLFQNLVGNAVKFRSPDRAVEIRVSARQEGGHWLFTVQDNGIGFDEKYQDKMFLIFQRLHSRGKYPGTGIGLAICKRIVERHGGKIWASGRLDQGAAFYFTISIENDT